MYKVFNSTYDSTKYFTLIVSREIKFLVPYMRSNLIQHSIVLSDFGFAPQNITYFLSTYGITYISRGL